MSFLDDDDSYFVTQLSMVSAVEIPRVNWWKASYETKKKHMIVLKTKSHI